MFIAGRGTPTSASGSVMSHTTSPTPSPSSSPRKTPPSNSQHAHSAPSPHHTPPCPTSQSRPLPECPFPAPSFHHNTQIRRNANSSRHAITRRQPNPITSHPLLCREPHPATNNLRTPAPLNRSSKSVLTNAELTDFVITTSPGSGVA